MACKMTKLTLMVCSDRQGNVLGMVQDIADCLVWARESGAKFNFDKVRKLLNHFHTALRPSLNIYDI